MIKTLPLLAALFFVTTASADTYTETFDEGPGTFTYSDAQVYAEDTYPSGAIGVQLGNLDDDNVLDMAGGWTALFSGSGMATVTVEFNVKDSGTTEEGECVRAEVFIDVVHVELLGELCGILSPGEVVRELGTQTKTFSVDLGPTEREFSIQLVGRMTKKTYRNEIGDVEFFSITVVTENAPPPVEPPVPTGDCPKPTIETSCYGVAYPEFDMCWDQASGPVDHYSVRSNGVEIATSTTERTTITCGDGAAEPAGVQGEMIITVVPVKADGTEGPVSDASASVYCSCPAPDLGCNGNTNLRDLNLWRKLNSLGCRSFYPGAQY